MTQNEKDLLLKDLCARLSYGVRIAYRCNHIHELRAILKNGLVLIADVITNEYVTTSVENIIPYLFPLSSTTDEQKQELNKLSEKECYIIEDVVNNPTPSNIGFPVVTHYMVDWCNKNHFDYRGLIPLNLANNATGKNIY